MEIEGLLPGVDLSELVTRAKFEELCADLFRQTLLPVERVLEDASLTKRDVDEVVLVGGSTRIPKIRQMLSDFFGGKQLCSSINPDEAVAVGAAVQAGVLGGGLAAAGGALAKASNELVLMDVVPLSLGIETTGRVMSTVVKRNTPIPCRKARTYTTVGDYQTEIDVVIYEGELESLRRFKDDVNDVRNGTECGIGVRNYNDVRPGDSIEVFDTKEIAREL